MIIGIIIAGAIDIRWTVENRYGLSRPLDKTDYR